MRKAERRADFSGCCWLWPALAAWPAPATPALIAEVQTALDKGDAQHAANLAEAALKEAGISARRAGAAVALSRPGAGTAGRA